MRIKNIVITPKMPKKYDFAIHFTVLVLLLFGTLMIVSTTVGNASSVLSIIIAFVKQAVFLVVSYTLMVLLANNFTMQKAQKWLVPIFVGLMAAMIATQFFPDVYGSKAWIRIPLGFTQVTLQPSEFVKTFMVIVLAVYVEIYARRNYKWTTVMRIPIIFLLSFILMIFIQKDIGTLAVMLSMVGVCFLIPSHKNLRKPQKILLILICTGIGFLLFLMSEPGMEVVRWFGEKFPYFAHITTRFENAINPFLDPYVGGYQPINGLYGIARGGLQGVGFGESIQKYGYLTQSDNDYILSIVIEELGVFGLGIIVAGYAIIIKRLFYYAFRTKSEGYKVILIGTAMYIFAHFVLNVGGVGGLIPLTGVPLLFISSGGSSMMSIMSAIGISQAIIARIRRQGTIQKKIKYKKEPQN